MTKPSTSASGTGRGRRPMQPPTRRRHWKSLLLAVVAALVVGFAVWPRPAPPTSYLRFTSPALPDGVRYTFLYPSTLDDVWVHRAPMNYQGKYIQNAMISKKESRVLGAALWHNLFKPESEYVFVYVEHPTTKSPKNSRSEKQTASHAEVYHTVEVDDLSAHEHFKFIHDEDDGTALYTQHDAVVTGSFRVLMPGEAVPNP